MYSACANGDVCVEARNLISSGSFSTAYDLLRKVVSNERTAEWFYLAGVSAMKLGYYSEGEDFIERAKMMCPDNKEYYNAYRSYDDYGYDYDDRARRYNNSRRYDSNGCCCPCCCCCDDDCGDTCCKLWCADSCCECMGGDLITCC